MMSTKTSTAISGIKNYLAVVITLPSSWLFSQRQLEVFLQIQVHTRTQLPNIPCIRIPIESILEMTWPCRCSWASECPPLLCQVSAMTVMLIDQRILWGSLVANVGNLHNSTHKRNSDSVVIANVHTPSFYTSWIYEIQPRIPYMRL